MYVCMYVHTVQIKLLIVLKFYKYNQLGAKFILSIFIISIFISLYMFRAYQTVIHTE